MKNILLVSFLSLLLLGCGNKVSDRKVESEDDLADDKEKLSYSLGVYFGNQIKLFESLDLDVLMTGIKHSYTDQEPIFDEQQIGDIIIENQQEALRKATEEATGKSDEFLAKNAENEEYTVLDSGIQYRVITEGSGDMPTIDDTIEVHYKGTLVNGEEFDSSYQRNMTAVFPLNGVIPGWQEVLPLMSVGSTWEVIIPPDLAYGERGSGRIGPNEVLIFEINLIDIKK